MLHIRRKPGQSVKIGCATVTLLEIDIQRRQVKLGIEAPRDIEVLRDDAKVTTRNPHRETEP